jgi:hypothetical protein
MNQSGVYLLIKIIGGVSFMKLFCSLGGMKGTTILEKEILVSRSFDISSETW